MNQKTIDEQELEQILFLLNKKAKNLRDAEAELIQMCQSACYRNDETILELIKERLEDIKKRKNEYYEKKDILLHTYYEPICIHKNTLYRYVPVFRSNLKDVNLEKLLALDLKKCFFRLFLVERFQKRPKEFTYKGVRRKTICLCFNDLITNEETIAAICEDIREQFPYVVVRGHKIYIPRNFRVNFDSIFANHLWNGETLEDCTDTEQSFKTFFSFHDIRIQKAYKKERYKDDYYLFYKTSHCSFHYPIEDCSEYPHLNVYCVDLNSHGMDESFLMTDDELNQLYDKLLHKQAAL